MDALGFHSKSTHPGRPDADFNEAHAAMEAIAADGWVVGTGGSGWSLKGFGVGDEHCRQRGGWETSTGCFQ